MKKNFEHGSRDPAQFYYWMRERHDIYLRRGRPRPWTKDAVLHTYKFCNVFRQLDRGTVVLNKMIDRSAPGHLILWNAVWYRLFNWRGNAKWFTNNQDLRVHITRRWGRGETIFTSAHMTSSKAGVPKHESMLDTSGDVFDVSEKIYDRCVESQSMEEVFGLLLPFYAVGPFVAYEIVCDLRFVLSAFNPTDVMSWANVGPGAKRGMQRLGLPPTLDTMRQLLNAFGGIPCEWPFELREIEHSLCEFDKYCRIQETGGKAMRRYL